MRAIVMKVRRARVTIREDATIVETGAIEAGMLVYLGIAPEDTQVEVDWLAKKIAEMRLFSGDGGFVDKPITEAGGAVLFVSQFTLYADTRRGRRPDFTGAAPSATAQPLYEAVAAAWRGLGLRVETGRFGANMQIESVHDGPLTITLDSSDMDRPRRG